MDVNKENGECNYTHLQSKVDVSTQWECDRSDVDVSTQSECDSADVDVSTQSECDRTDTDVSTQSECDRTDIDSTQSECDRTDTDVSTQSECDRTDMDSTQSVSQMNVDDKDPLQTFKEQFGNICNLHKSDFEKANTKTPSRFERLVKKTLAAFNSKWHPSQARKEYIETFSLQKWEALPDTTKKAHSISNCIACSLHHNSLQAAIPLKPLFVYNTSDNVENIQNSSNEKVTGKQFVQRHYQQFNSFCLASTGKPFSDIALNHVSDIKAGLKQTKVKTMRKCRDDCNNALSENALIRVHSQNHKHKFVNE